MSDTNTPPSPRRGRKDNHEFGVVRLRELPLNLLACECPDGVYEYWMANIVTAQWFNPDVECLCVIHLNTRLKALGLHLVGVGILDSFLIHPREVFRTAIVRGCRAGCCAQPSQWGPISHSGGHQDDSRPDPRWSPATDGSGRSRHHRSSGRSRARPWVSLRELGYFA